MGPERPYLCINIDKTATETALKRRNTVLSNAVQAFPIDMMSIPMSSCSFT